jgi:hypothetical protein
VTGLEAVDVGAERDQEILPEKARHDRVRVGADRIPFLGKRVFGW